MRLKKKMQESKEKIVESSPLDLQDLLSSLDDYLEEEGELLTPTSWFLDSGNYSLNYILSGKINGGWPGGQTCEVFGDPSTGKTLLMMKAVAQHQNMGGIALVQDVERRWDWDFAKFHGVDVGTVIKDSPETIEDFSVRTDHILSEIMKKDPIPKLLICTDSIAAMSTIWEMENIGTKEDQGKKAKRIKAAMRVIPKKVSKAGAILMISNHLIADPRITYGSNQITPGGKGIAFQSTVRLEMAKPSLLTLEGKNRPIGSVLNIKCTKNSITPPFGETKLTVTWTNGIDRYSGLLDTMLDLDIVHGGGGWYQYKDYRKFRANELQNIIEEYPDILEDPVWDSPYFKAG